MVSWMFDFKILGRAQLEVTKSGLRAWEQLAEAGLRRLLSRVLEAPLGTEKPGCSMDRVCRCRSH